MKTLMVACVGTLMAMSMFVSVVSQAAFAQGSPLGQFDGHDDVGSPKISGSATYNAVSQEYAISAAGVNMWANRDEFHFVWKRMKGNFILQARVELIGKGVDPHRKLGWMVRTGLDPDSPYADATVHGAARVIARHSHNQLPVVDGDNKLVGLVTRLDVLRALSSDGLGLDE